MNNTGNKQAYDRGVNTFSPDGRLYQVEYAREAVQRGSPSIGVRTEAGVVLGAHLATTSDLRVSESIEKIHKVDDSIAVSSSGHVADGRKLVDQLRLLTRRDELRYGELPKVDQLARNLCDHIQETTQVAGSRPYGASLLIAGVDADGPHIYEVEPGGTPTEWFAAAIGNNRSEYTQYLEDHYATEAFTIDDGITLILDALSELSETELSPETVEIVTIEDDDPMTTVEFDEDAFEEYLGGH